MRLTCAEYYDRTDAHHRHRSLLTLTSGNEPPTFTKMEFARQFRWRLPLIPTYAAYFEQLPDSRRVEPSSPAAAFGLRTIEA
jgi:hypothetical protein